MAQSLGHVGISGFCEEDATHSDPRRRRSTRRVLRLSEPLGQQTACHHFAARRSFGFFLEPRLVFGEGTMSRGHPKHT